VKSFYVYLCYKLSFQFSDIRFPLRHSLFCCFCSFRKCFSTISASFLRNRRRLTTSFTYLQKNKFKL